MAQIKTIPPSTPGGTSKDEFNYTLVRVLRNPHTKDNAELCAFVQAFESKFPAAHDEEKGLLLADLSAGAAVQFADMDLNDSVDFVGNNIDRDSLLGARLFGDLRPSELKKPVLGGQLQIMAEWPAALEQTDHEVLKNHLPVLSQRVAAGHAAAEEKKGTTAKLADFRKVGTRVKLNAEFNAFRKSLFGKLGDIQHANNLPSGWAESFFKQDASDDLTVTDLDRKIGALEAQLEAFKKQRDAMKEQEVKIAAAKAAASRNQKKAKLDGLAKAKAEIEAQEAALKAELDADDGGKDA